MRVNTSFPVAIHILVLLALHEGGLTTSELIARSVNTNPVVIRRINGMLKKANLITVRAGVGGASLNKEAKEITLLDIYRAVRQPEDRMLFDLHENPSMKCFVGRGIHDALAEPLQAAQESMEKSLRKFTLFDVANKITKKGGRP